MSKFQLVIADQDLDYLEHVTHYIRTTEYAERFVVKTFSQRDSLEQYIHGGNEIHLLVVQAHFLKDSLLANSVQTMVYLAEENETKENHVKTVFKYQPLHLLFSKLLSLHLEKHHETPYRSTKDRQTKIVSVYSATGGCGKTTLAMNLAKEAATFGTSVFYLNFEFLSSFGHFLPSSGEDSFSKLLYYLKSNPDQLAARIEQLKQHDLSTKIDYFDPLTNPAEILEMTKEDIGSLITSLIQVNFYDLIVIELDSTIHEKNLAAFLHSDEILWLVTDDVFILDKTQLMTRELKRLLGDDYVTISPSMKFILNKHTGKLGNQFDHFSIDLFEKLPYVPEWKTVTSPEQMLSSTPYNNKMRELYKSLMSGRESGRIAD